MNFPLLIHLQRLNVSLYAAVLCWSVSSDFVDWSHLPHVKCNSEKQGKEKHKTSVAKMCNCGQFEIKMYLSEIAFEMQSTISFSSDLIGFQMTMIWDDGTMW